MGSHGGRVARGSFGASDGRPSRELSDRFVRNVAHDLNNVLAVLLASAEVLDETSTDQELIADLRAAARRGIALTGRLSALGEPPATPTERREVAGSLRELATVARRLLPGARIDVQDVLGADGAGDSSLESELPEEFLLRFVVVALLELDPVVAARGTVDLRASLRRPPPAPEGAPTDLVIEVHAEKSRGQECVFRPSSDRFEQWSQRLRQLGGSIERESNGRLKMQFPLVGD